MSTISTITSTPKKQVESIYNDILTLEKSFFHDDLQLKSNFLLLLSRFYTKAKYFPDNVTEHLELLNNITEAIKNKTITKKELENCKINIPKQEYSMMYVKTHQNDLYYCPDCNYNIKYYSKALHMTSKKHIKNSSK